MVRVQGREYGPVSLDVLREWRDDGRLIRDNEIRRVDSRDWMHAGNLAALFPDEPPPLPAAAVEPSTISGILRQTFAIYRRGFWQFVALALLLAVPSLLLQMALPNVTDQAFARPTPAALLLLALCIVAFPFSVAATQFLADDIARGEAPNFIGVLSRSKPIWPRILLLALLVYGSYALWVGLPLAASYSIVASEPTLPSLLLVLLLLVFVMFMAARLFINFLFWQQSGTLGDVGGIEALRESKELARSGRDAPPLARPLVRGAIIASVWLLALLILSALIEVPFVAMQLRGAASPEELVARAQALATAPTAPGWSLATQILSTSLHVLLRPLLAIAFVLLYRDAKRADQPNDR